MKVRLAGRKDSPAIARIFNQGIEDRIATFETRSASDKEIRAWFDGVHPIVVVEHEKKVIGFAASSEFRAEKCFAGVADFAVYVQRKMRRTHIGRTAMLRLIEEASDAGFWKLTGAVFAENAACRAMLRAVGFREVGIFVHHAQLEGQWKEVVIVERLTDTTRPAPRKR